VTSRYGFRSQPAQNSRCTAFLSGQRHILGVPLLSNPDAYYHILGSRELPKEGGQPDFLSQSGQRGWVSALLPQNTRCLMKGNNSPSEPWLTEKGKRSGFLTY